MTKINESVVSPEKALQDLFLEAKKRGDKKSSAKARARARARAGLMPRSKPKAKRNRLEDWLERELRKKLRALGFLVEQKGGPSGKGSLVPDIIATLNGHRVVFELKTPECGLSLSNRNEVPVYLKNLGPDVVAFGILTNGEQAFAYWQLKETPPAPRCAALTPVQSADVVLALCKACKRYKTPAKVAERMNQLHEGWTNARMEANKRRKRLIETLKAQILSPNEKFCRVVSRSLIRREDGWVEVQSILKALKF